MAKPYRQVRHFAAYLLSKMFVAVVQMVPRPVMLPLSALLGQAARFVLVPYSKQIRQNLDLVYGDTKSIREKRKIESGVFANLGMTICDTIKIPSFTHKKFQKLVISDLTAIRKSIAIDQQGVIVLGAHLSCFELQSQIFAVAGFPIVVIGAELFDTRINKEVETLRRRNGTIYLNRDGAGRRLLKELRANRIFGALLDQDATSDGVFAEFLGKLAFTPTGPIRMALKFKIPLYFILLERQPDFTYQFTIHGPIEPPATGDETKDIVLMAQQYNDLMSQQILKCPEQWVWMHRRWRRKRENYPDIPSITDYRSNE